MMPVIFSCTEKWKITFHVSHLRGAASLLTPDTSLHWTILKGTTMGTARSAKLKLRSDCRPVMFRSHVPLIFKLYMDSLGRFRLVPKLSHISGGWPVRPGFTL